MIQIGIILPNLSSSQLAYYAIKYANKLLEENKYDIVFFYEELAPISIAPRCAIMNITEIWSFTGLLISTTINNTLMSNKAITNCKRIFYVWDLEWLRSGKQNYLYNLQAYRAPVKLIARSIDHAKVIDNYCNRRVDAVIPNFQIQSFLGV